MKVKTLLKTFKNIEYVLQSENGWTLEDEAISDYAPYIEGLSKYDDYKVVKITTANNEYCRTLYITIKP